MYVAQTTNDDTLVCPFPFTRASSRARKMASEKREELVMYSVVNQDLKMSKGKACAQAQHAAVLCYSKSEPHLRDAWLHGSYPKIVLKADENQLVNLHQRYPLKSVLVVDEGRTQIEPGSKTVLGFVIDRKDAFPELKDLKLLN